MRIEIKKKDVMDRAAELAEYMGDKAGAWEQVRMIEEDEALLQKWLSDGATYVESLLAAAIDDKGEADGTMWLETGHVNGNDEAASAAATELLATLLLTNWLADVMPSAAEKVAMTIEAGQQKLLVLTFQRKFPL